MTAVSADDRWRHCRLAGDGVVIGGDAGGDSSCGGVGLGSFVNLAC